MSTGHTATPSVSPLRKLAILVVVVITGTLYGTTLLVVSTILPQMQGSLSATPDEIAWVVTFNILATAIATPMSGWLTARFGVRQVMIWSMSAFTLSTFMCGFADSLEALVFWRILQGAFGAPARGAQNASTIKAIEIVGNRQYQDELINYFVETEVGEEYDPESIRRDFRVLYNSGYFANIKIFKKQEPDGIGRPLLYRQGHRGIEHRRAPRQLHPFPTMQHAADMPPGQYMFPFCDDPAQMKDPAFKERWKAGPHGNLLIAKSP